MVKHTHLIDQIYATASNPDAWTPMLHELIEATDSRSARMLVLNAEADKVTSSIKINIDDSYHRQYVDYYVNKCPWRPELRRRPPGRLYSTYLHFSCRQPDFYNTEFFNDWARTQDIHHGICGTIYQDDDKTIQLLIQRTRDQGHYTEADAEAVNRLVPHMQHSLLIAGKIAGSRAQAEAIAMAAGYEALPFLVMDKSLKVIFFTSAAKSLITEIALLGIKKDKLFIKDELYNKRLNRLLQQCLKAADSRLFHTAGESLAIQRPGSQNLHLVIRPLHPEIPLLLGQSGLYVAVYFYEPEAPVTLDSERLRSLYALSEAEARVAAAMVATPDSAEISKQCAISMHTVRSHVKSIFAKTQTHNRAELMKCLLTGPARLR